MYGKDYMAQSYLIVSLAVDYDNELIVYAIVFTLDFSSYEIFSLSGL